MKEEVEKQAEEEVVESTIEETKINYFTDEVTKNIVTLVKEFIVNKEDNINELKDEYDELLKKKQELEEDINYLQIEYEEFRDNVAGGVS